MVRGRIREELMGHNLADDTMAYVGEVPWHGLGTRVPETVTAAEMIKAAGLDWQIEKRPAAGAKMDHKKRASLYELVRLPRSANENEILFGTATHAYEPLNNDQAFEFFEPFISGGLARFHTAGALGQGEKVWVLAKLPEIIQVAAGDDVERYLLLSNSHTGRGAVTVRFTPIRVVCQNTLCLALKDKQTAVAVRHSKNMDRRLYQTQQEKLLRLTASMYRRAAENFRRLAAKQIEGEQLEQYLASVLPATSNQKSKGERPERWDRVIHLFEDPALNPKSIRGTYWAAYNAITRDEDYRRSREADASRRLERVWFGTGEALKVRALATAISMAGA